MFNLRDGWWMIHSTAVTLMWWSIGVVLVMDWFFFLNTSDAAVHIKQFAIMSE